MHHRWIQQKGGTKTVVIVFGGWAVGWAPFTHLAGPEDVLFVEDYRDLNHALPDLGGYDQRWLLAYSLGVASFGHWAKGRVFDRAVAACGSLTPVDRRLGIPAQVYQATQDGLTEDSYQGFLALCHGHEVAEQEVDIPARQAELAAIADRGPAPVTQFDRVLIADKDRIWPKANLARAWDGQNVVHLDAPHVTFSGFQTWRDLFEGRL